MKEWSLADIPRGIDKSRIFTGVVSNVNSASMLMDVEIVEIQMRVRDIAIPPLYISNSQKSGVVAVPRVGDSVLLALKQSEWVVIGYNIAKYRDDTNTVRTAWQDIVDKSGNGIPAFELTEGDFGIFVHENDKAVDMLLLKDGKFILSSGLAYMVVDQQDSSFRYMFDYMSKTVAGGIATLECGFPSIDNNGKKKYIVYDHFFGYRSANEDFEIGYVNDNGIPAKTKSGGNVRARIKVGNAVITIGDDNSIEIKTTSKVFIDSSEANVDVGTVRVKGQKMKIEENEIDINAEDVSLDTNAVSINADNIDIEAKSASLNIDSLKVDSNEVKVESDSVEISGSKTKLTSNSMEIDSGNMSMDVQSMNVNAQSASIGGDVPLVLSTILSILESHTHPYSDGVTGPSPSLADASFTYATKIVKGS